MNITGFLSSQLWTARLSSVLLHFVWQGIVIGALYAATRKIAGRQASSNTLYAIACGALALIALAPVITWFVLAPPPASSIAETFKLPLSAVSSYDLGNASTLWVAELKADTWIQPWIVSIWLIGAIVCLIRMFGGWILAERMRSLAATRASTEWDSVLARLKDRLAVVRPVVLRLSDSIHAPAVVGWLRPVLVMPAGALAGLPAEQMEALLLHELAHIRRRDYLVNLLQSVVESLLFYHPVVWWISGDIRSEREGCCDDLAVSVTGDVITYARALAQLESLRQSYSTPAMAASGGSLANRIASLAGIPRPASYSASGAGIVVAAAILVISPFTLLGQLTPRPKFEVASIKPVPDNRGLMTVQPQPGRLTANASLQMLMQNAYGVHAFQVVGGPSWLNSDRFQIEAKADGAATREQVFQMLQSLLEERYQLKIHREERELPVFALTVAKGGIKLPSPKEGGCVEPTPATPPDWSGGRMLGPQATLSALRCGSIRIALGMAGAQLQGSKVAMVELTRMLSLAMDRTVIDRTGFTGLFDVQLAFVPDDTTSAMPPPPPGAAAAAELQAPPIIVALEEQLGLKLEATRGPVEVLVIDHVERPVSDQF